MKKSIFTNMTKIQLNSNQLKIVAIITMIIDHTGYYMCNNMSTVCYYICRAIGRLSMPIFIYLLVQGFFHTKNFKRYLGRIFGLAVITQGVTYLLGILNKQKFGNYIININSFFNILFSFTIVLILLYIIHNKKIVNKWDYNKNMFLKIFLIIGIIGIYVFVPIDYGFRIPFIAILFYAIEKLNISIHMNRQSIQFTPKNMLSKMTSEKTMRLIYVFALATTLILSLRFATEPLWLNTISVLSIIPIAMYNWEKGRKNRKLDTAFYFVFPIHHLLLYLLGMLI